MGEELKILLECNSPYIVKCYGAFYTDATFFIILEYMDKGSLHSVYKKVKKINEAVLGLILWEILKGLDYLHEKKIFHRDIKP